MEMKKNTFIFWILSQIIRMQIASWIFMFQLVSMGTNWFEMRFANWFQWGPIGFNRDLPIGFNGDQSV